jgi:hypothetical protein
MKDTPIIDKVKVIKKQYNSVREKICGQILHSQNPHLNINASNPGDIL